MDGKDEAIRRTGQEDAARRDAQAADVDGHRFRGGSPADDAPQAEGGFRRNLVDPDEADVEGHRFRGI